MPRLNRPNRILRIDAAKRLHKGGSFFFRMGAFSYRASLFTSFHGTLPKPVHTARRYSLRHRFEQLGRRPPSKGMVLMHRMRPRLLPPGLATYGVPQTFDFIPTNRHLIAASNLDRNDQTLLGSMAHLSLAVDSKKNAFVVQAQGNVVGWPRNDYPDMMAALFLSAHRYCEEKGLTLHVLHPSTYVDVARATWPHKISKDVAAQMTFRYKTLHRLAKRLFQTHPTMVPPPDVFSLLDRAHVFRALAVSGPKRSLETSAHPS